jgi:hypothetical protein
MKQAQSRYENRIATMDHQILMLALNRSAGSKTTGLKAADLQKMSEQQTANMAKYLSEKGIAQKLLEKTNEVLGKYEEQLNAEVNNAIQNGGMIIVKFYAKEATNCAISIDYVTTLASWTPTYDVFMVDAQRPLNIVQKASIKQNTGVAWEDVHLTLSTGNPQEGMQAPTLSALHLKFEEIADYEERKEDISKIDKYGKGKYKTQEGIPLGIDPDITGGTESTTKGTYSASLSSPPPPTEIGYTEHLSLNNGGVNTTYNIDLPYTITADDQEHVVAVKRYEVASAYRYFTAPSADRDAFVQGRIANWQDLNLLPGTTNIYNDGTYVGQGVINTQNVADTMDLSLGRDKKIVVKRDLDSKLRSVRNIGSNVHEAFAYNITVRNTRKEKVDILVQDQMPISNDKELSIEDKEYAGAEYNESTGILSWHLTLGPNETKVLPFSYSIKYPKGKKLGGL